MKTGEMKDKKAWIKIVYLAVAAFILVLFASRSSFLYPCNDWNDANSYFSVGKALMNGKVPYRDVFDQKGMYLYFLYGLAYLVSHTTFRGVFLVEGLLALADLLTLYRILNYIPRAVLHWCWHRCRWRLFFLLKAFTGAAVQRKFVCPFFCGGYTCL